MIPQKKNFRLFFILLFWLSVWQAAAWAAKSQILLVGPLETGKELFSLLPQKEFWLSVLNSFCKISSGFLAAFFLGIALGGLAFSLPLFRELFSPAIAFMKSVPVASFVILALIWAGSKGLSRLIAFLVVFPIIYLNTLAGLSSRDPKMLEMSGVFHIRGWRKFSGLTWPALFPYLVSGCKTALGMSWKSGIAAEVIGVPEGTVGEHLYLSKIYLNTAGLFAWTLVIILVSAGVEKLFLLLLGQTGKGKLFLFPKVGRKTGPAGPVQEPAQPLPSKGKLSVCNLSKQYGMPVLNRLNLTLDSGRPCCIMGPSGSGKTTLLRILLGLEAPDGGFVKADGFPEGRPVRFSAVFQEDRLCEGFSPVDNIRLAVPSLSKPEIESQLLNLLPEESLNRPVSTLSGGQKRRAAIARALLAPSDVIIMDEPFTGLDEKTKETVFQYVLEKSAGKLLILSTHQEEDVDYCSGRAVYLPEGK